MFSKAMRGALQPRCASQYDISDACNLQCEGCLFFSGQEYKLHPATTDIDAVDAFFAQEAARGISYVYLAGAEPSLEPAKIAAAYKHIPFGMVATNGIKKISTDIGYRIHVSLWGLPQQSAKLRGADTVQKQLNNYQHDIRAVFVFTINRENIKDLGAVAALCAAAGVKLTFNHYSPTETYQNQIHLAEKRDAYFRFSDKANNLILRSEDLRQSRNAISQLLVEYPHTIVYDSDFNDWIHQDILHQLNNTGVAIGCPSRTGEKFKHFNADLSESTMKCCSPNIACGSCRLYIQSLASALRNPTIHVRGPKWWAFATLWEKLYLPVEVASP